MPFKLNLGRLPENSISFSLGMSQKQEAQDMEVSTRRPKLQLENRPLQISSWRHNAWTHPSCPPLHILILEEGSLCISSHSSTDKKSPWKGCLWGTSQVQFNVTLADHPGCLPVGDTQIESKLRFLNQGRELILNKYLYFTIDLTGSQITSSGYITLRGLC